MRVERETICLETTPTNPISSQALAARLHHTLNKENDDQRHSVIARPTLIWLSYPVFKVRNSGLTPLLKKSGDARLRIFG
jgi:hypothetical protein